MTRRLRRNYSLCIVVPFIATLILLIAAAMLAQTSGARQTTRKPNAVLAPAVTSTSAQAARPSIPWSGAGSSPVSRSQTKRHGAHPMDSNPLFLPAVTYGSGGQYAWSVAVADVNGDGKLDLVVANDCGAPGNCYKHGSIGVLLGNGDGTFQPAVAYPSGGGEALSVAIADVNGDGKPDVVVANYYGPDGYHGVVGVLLGNGDGTFQPAVTYESGAYEAESIAVADVNGDGHPDILVGNRQDYVGNYNWNVGVLLGNGDGTFQPAELYFGGGSSIAVADVNGDGKLDLLVSNSCGGQGCAGTVGVLLGNGDGTFQGAVTWDSGGLFASGVAIADVNGDGKLDIVVANSGDGKVNGSVGVLLGNGDGTFQPVVAYDSGGVSTNGVAIADVNGDGKPDLVVANKSDSTLGILLGNGDGTFQPAVIYNSGGVGPNSVVAADVDGNGEPDLLVANVCDPNCATGGGVGVLLHVGAVPTTITLVSAPNPSVFGQPVSFTAAVGSSSGTPTGVVELLDGSAVLGSGSLANGVVVISVSSLGVGSHLVIALYQGSTKFKSSTSAPLNQIVNAAATSSSLASSLNPALVREPVIYTATVASQYGGATTGTITFQDGGSTVATANVVGNQAAYMTSYKRPSIHSMTATYSGDSNNVGSMSAPLVEKIDKAGFSSKTVLTTSGSPSHVGQPVTFTATVTSQHGAIPDGELVLFYDGKAEIGTATTASGVAAFTTSSLTAKRHTIKGTYTGDDKFETSTGSVLQVVKK